MALLCHAAAARVAICRASAVTCFRNTSRTPAPQDSGRSRILFHGARRDGAACDFPLVKLAALRDKHEYRRTSSFSSFSSNVALLFMASGLIGILFLLKERTLVEVGQVAPSIWRLLVGVGRQGMHARLVCY